MTIKKLLPLFQKCPLVGDANPEGNYSYINAIKGKKRFPGPSNTWMGDVFVPIASFLSPDECINKAQFLCFKIFSYFRNMDGFSKMMEITSADCSIVHRKKPAAASLVGCPLKADRLNTFNLDSEWNTFREMQD